MDQQTIVTSDAPEVLVEQVLGNLQIKGWEEARLVVKANPEDVDLQEQDDVVQFRCRGNCTLRLPSAASIKAGDIHGEARFKLLEDALEIETVHGDLILRNIAEVHIGSVHGELTARNIQGSLRAERVQGNLYCRNVQGDCLVDEVQGNADFRDIEGDLQVSARGNLRVRLGMLAGSSYTLQADGNVQCRIPEDASLQIELESDGGNIRVRLPQETRNAQASRLNLTMGDGEASLKIRAGGEISLTSQEPDWGDEDSPEDFQGDPGFGRNLSQQIEAQIEAQMESMTRQLNEHLANISASFGRSGYTSEDTERILQQAREAGERAASRAQEKMRRAQERLEHKLEAARRRNEAKAQAMERRMQGRGGRDWNFGAAQPARDSATEEERLMILRMLEQKKISLEEADQLLDALEGRE